MKFRNWEMHVVGKSQLAISFQFGRQNYIMFVSFKNSCYEISEVFHDGEGVCSNCFCVMEKEKTTACLCFTVNAKNSSLLDREVIAKLNQKLEFDGVSLTLAGNRAERTKQYLTRIDVLTATSVRERDTILFFDSQFTYYITIRGLESYKVNLAGAVSAYEKQETPTQLIIARELFTYMKNNHPKSLGQLEAELIFMHDVVGKKKTKLPLIIDSLKKCIQLFEEVAEPFQSESFQLLIAYLNEVLYRELSIEYENEKEFLAMHETMAAEIYTYTSEEISYEECIERIFDKSKIELPNRKDRVIFAIKSLQMLEQVFFTLQETYAAKAHVWFQAVFHKMFNYLRLDLGITYETDTVTRHEKDEYLHHTLRQFFAGNLQEVDTYEQINYRLPFIGMGLFEEINQLLQKAAKRRKGYVYYLMEIPFLDSLEESLVHHSAFSGINHIKAEPIDIKEHEEPLHKWLDDEESINALIAMISELLEDDLSKSWEITVSPKRPNQGEMTEYILFDGDRLYRLHFRKNA